MRIGANVKINLLRREGKTGSLVLNKKGGLSYLEHLIGRLKELPQLEVFLTATPNDDCDELQKIAQKEKLPLFFDSEHDRHRRLLNAIIEFKVDAMLDVPAIFTAIGLHHTHKMVEKHLQSQADITVPINYPNGAIPLSIYSAKAMENIVAVDYEEPYYKDFEKLPGDLNVCDFLLEGQRSYLESQLILYPKNNQQRINFLLEQNPTSSLAETALYEKLNIQDKYDLLMKPATHYIIEPTNYCNLRCISCPTGLGIAKREKGFMTLENFNKIIKHFPQTTQLSLYGLGESFINKNIYSMINACDGMYTCISTNGHFFHSEKNRRNLVNSKLTRLVVAIDGASEETYSKYRKRGMFTRITNDIKELIRLRNSLGKKNPIIDMHFLIFNFNEHELDQAKVLAADLGVDELIFKPTSGPYSGKSLPRVRKDRRIVTAMGRRLMIPLETCTNTPRAMWNGDYSPCCCLSDDQMLLGNLLLQNPEEIKNSAPFQEFAHRRAALEEDACAKRNCHCYS